MNAPSRFTLTLGAWTSFPITLEISVATQFLDEQSDPDGGRYVFAYTIRIRNLGRLPAQLLDRHWLITDGNGKVEEVRGEGVVGEQPRLEPGEAFTYTRARCWKPRSAPCRAATA